MDKPWFKFTAADWLSGSIQLLNSDEKGTYIDLVAMIWKEGGSIKLSKILSRKLRLDHATACERIESYCELNIMVCESDVLTVKFLSNQIESLNEVSRKNSENASKRWSKKESPMRPNANKKREEEKREDIKENIKEKTKADKSTTTKTIEDREKTFYDKLGEEWKSKIPDMSKEEVRKFYEYWTERGDNDKKMRFEKEKTFGISRRLKTWNNNNFSGDQQTEAPQIYL